MKSTHKQSRAGFTLIETMISIGIFMILVTIAIGGFIQALHTQGEVGTLISAQSNVSLGIEEMAREIRTGYLFCHAGASSTESGCDSLPLEPPAKCNTLIDSGYPDSSASSSLGNGDLPIWSCPALNFFNANSENVRYSLSTSGQLIRTDSSQNNGPQPLTSSDVKVTYLKFFLFGNTEGDGWAPRITIMLGIAPSSTDPAIENNVLHFETTVSARQIDCVPNATPTKC